jgi:Family of unknown function (DUF6159)
VILYEPLGVIASIKRSGSIFRQRWGETFVGTAAIGLALFLLALPVILLAVLLGAVSMPLGLAVGVILVAVMAAVGSALSGVYNAALYRYATSGEAGGAFQPADLQGAFRPKRGR